MAIFFPNSRVSRRRFLKNSALATGTLLGAGVVLDACGTSPTATSSSTGTLTIMGSPGEMTPAYLKEFENMNPGVKVNFLAFDQTHLNAMFAAGSPPDLIRGVGFSSAFYSARGLALNLDPYLEKSTVLKKADLLPINDLWRWDGKQQGQGPYYGLTKDWSMDGTLWCNNDLFQKAGITPLSDTTPVTYDEFLALGKRLAVRQGGKIQIYGIDPQWGSATSLYQMVAQQNGRIFSEDLTKADFTAPEVLKAMKWYVDYAQAHIGPSPLDPDPNGDGPTYLAGRLGVAQYGYWFGGEIATGSAALQASSRLYPAPVFGSRRISSCFSATGQWIPTASQQKDLAWKFVEYYMTGTPARDRAISGWGIPALKQFVAQMPQKTDAQKQAYQAVQNEMQYFSVLPNTPYTTSGAVATVLNQYLQPVIQNQSSLESAARQITTTVNLLLKQGQQTAG